MQKINVCILLVVFYLAVNIPCAYANNVPQPINNLDNARFNTTTALTGIQNINDWLKSFRDLTKLTADRISPAEKNQVENLIWEIQNIAFYNWTKTVEGTLLKQEYEISKLEYELALERYDIGKLPYTDVTEKEKKYQTTKNNLQLFLSNFHIAN